ncbi:hypothetical protein L211DRAFT_846596 [Terfezia boudieri ATCC MYA-4762]|uniref:Uncharacterized protein n=1 Tax=Terfezia boudieri ATCC MYA-4762 TaxID=1051890 RepID=A0A3N4LVW1_9PEZI|nr:hypothetical protein L211DRAFT_846596 [Terfezia boudieri ATCC MYA-4762]
MEDRRFLIRSLATLVLIVLPTTLVVVFKWSSSSRSCLQVCWDSYTSWGLECRSGIVIEVECIELIFPDHTSDSHTLTPQHDRYHKFGWRSRESWAQTHKLIEYVPSGYLGLIMVSNSPSIHYFYGSPLPALFQASESK